MNELINILFKEVPIKILLEIDKKEETYATEINHELKGNYSYIVRLISEFEEQEIIKTHKEGRKNIIKLTKKGRKVVNIIKELIQEKNTSETEELHEDRYLQKLKKIEQKVNNIYKEEIREKEELKKEDSSRIGKRLGPYKRELGKIEKKELEDKTEQKYQELRKKITKIMEEKTKLEEEG